MSLLLLLGSGAAAAPAPTYALWNPLDRFTPNADPSSGSPLLSSDLLTVSMPGGWRAVRADTSVTAGDWFYQITVDVTNYVIIGVGTATCGLDYAGSGNSSAWGIATHGYNNFPGGYSSNGIAFSNGDVMGCSILRSTSRAKFYKLVAGNWSLVYDADISSVDGQALFPYCSVLDGTGTANFGASAFAAAVPDGANEGVYTV